MAVAACGASGDKGGEPKSSAGAAQIAAWEDATRIFDREFQDCGRRISPTRHFYAACMKQPFADYYETAAAVRRACKGTRLNAAVMAVGMQQREEVRLSDAALDAHLSRRRYRGPPLFTVGTRARRKVAGQIATVRRLGVAACTAR